MAPGGMRSEAATRASWLVPVVLAALVLGGAWHGHAPPRSADAYSKVAADTAAFLHSQLETARLWVESHPQDAFDTSVVVGIEEAERDAVVTLERFAGHDPPAGTNPLRTRLTALGQRATTLLGEMRIAAHRQDWDRVVRLSDAMARPSRRLEQVSVEARP